MANLQPMSPYKIIKVKVHPLVKGIDMDMDNLEQCSPSSPSTSQSLVNLDSDMTRYMMKWIPKMMQASADVGANDSSAVDCDTSDNDVTSLTASKYEPEVQSVEDIQEIFIDDPTNREHPASTVNDSEAFTSEMIDTLVVPPCVVAVPPPLKKRRHSLDKTVPEVQDENIEESQPSQPAKTIQKIQKQTEKAKHPPITVILEAEVERLKLIIRDHLRMNCDLTKKSKSLKEHLYVAEEKSRKLEAQLKKKNEVVRLQQRSLHAAGRKLLFQQGLLRSAEFSPEQMYDITQKTVDHLVTSDNKKAAMEFLESKKDTLMVNGYWAWRPRPINTTMAIPPVATSTSIAIPPASTNTSIAIPPQPPAPTNTAIAIQEL